MILNKVLVILLCILLFLGVYGALSDRQAPSFSSVVYTLENSEPVFPSDWIEKIRIPDELDPDDYPLISNTIEFINDFLLAPFRFLCQVAVLGLNVMAFAMRYYNAFIA